MNFQLVPALKNLLAAGVAEPQHQVAGIDHVHAAWIAAEQLEQALLSAAPEELLQQQAHTEGHRGLSGEG